MQSVGSLVAPVQKCSSRIVNWCQKEIQKLDVKTKNLLNHSNFYGQNHLRANTYSLYVPRKDGGRDLMQVERSNTVKL